MIPRRLISATALRRRVRRLADAIRPRYRRDNPVLVGVLQGSFVFMADLVRALKIPCTCEFVRVSSYGDGARSSGRVRIAPGLASRLLRGRHVLVVEDIVDTGHTLRAVLAHLRRSRPASLRVCTLLHKPTWTRGRVPLHYVGFRIPDVFVVGYGLDYAGRFRELPYIAAVHPGA